MANNNDNNQQENPKLIAIAKKATFDDLDDFQKSDANDFNSKLESFRKKHHFLGLPEDFKAILSKAIDPKHGGKLPNNPEPPIGGFNNNFINQGNAFSIGFGTNGFRFYVNPIAVIGIGINLFSQSYNKNTKELEEETARETEKYNQKRHKHKDLFFDIVRSNQTGRIFAGGDLYNAGAGSKQYDPLSVYEPYKYFMEQSDISLQDITAILKDDLPKAGKRSYYPGVDSKIDWAGQNKNIKSSQLLLNTSLRVTYQKFKEASKWWGTGKTLQRSLIFNYNLNDLLKRRTKALITDFKLKNK
ncbi:hypothetical protein BKH42_04120 [Helicobacter sp. 13S00482-2]|uniref:hypothetical protein n=1 Tax=Helicobacter sp. 13S00482-2 TaxID=1476200 RepID=UPI000BA69509|nr:hypothetical protein [Helicobacter sp. 13S00482-2]PAF53691.1 hypothetical protein BKH42_04120 [Helicobacter sp. 13S00482-2]